ncbi:MAG: thioredoxin family protein [Deltaproteobacteria bacterium]|nr:MAG: thioredoxin family protein [Deltaproteobacteria bacterium]
MGHIKIFTKGECPRCPAAKEIGNILQQEGIHVFYYDVETPDGLAEAAFYSVMSTPTIIIEDENERVLAGWRGSVPTLHEIQGVIRSQWSC